MRHWIVLLMCVLLGACASTPPGAEPPGQLLKDGLFQPPAAAIDRDAVFALSGEMRRYLREELRPSIRNDDRQRTLIQTLYRQRALKLEYDSAMTRNASEAFAARSGNCLSLVIMTAAIAKELGLPVQYQSAAIDETWSRNGDLYFHSGHVNLVLGRRPLGSRTLYDADEYVVVDFLPGEDIRGMRTRQIDESMVLAMYMNNRAAEALAQAQVNEAYWWAREAMRISPGFLPAYNTLGVTYLHGGHAAEAERVFAHVLAREPANLPAMANEAGALKALGRYAEAQQLVERLARIEPYPPFHFFNLGMAAMQAGDYRAARDWFAKEVDRAADYHEFQFWLGMANLRLGDMAEARKHLQAAMENSTTRHDRDIYAAKLDHLKAARRTRTQ